jgi:hypothetical protein
MVGGPRGRKPKYSLSPHGESIHVSGVDIFIVFIKKLEYTSFFNVFM